MDDDQRKMLDTLVADGVVEREVACLRPLTGGVSSEIYLVTGGDQSYVVKRALEKLNVADEWFADVTRNQTECEFIEYVAAFAPESVPRILHRGDGYFAMEYLESGFENWKSLLLSGYCRDEHAAMAARLLARVHARSRGDPRAKAQFDKADNFFELRVEPYLLTTGKRCPAFQEKFEVEARRLHNSRECLVHGDYSPKNILIAGGRLVVLDCEVANYGDPVFDYCFLINHLLLKGLYHSPRDVGLERCVREFRQSYRSHCGLDGDALAAFSMRAGQLLAMLLLARIDGKSPVEYLQDQDARQQVREFAIATLHEDAVDEAHLVGRWFAQLRA